MAALLIALTLFLVTISAVLYRLYTIFDSTSRRLRPRHTPKKRGKDTHLLVVLGSGGHTAEMIAMLQRAVEETDSTRRLNWTDYAHRTWIVGSTDALSAKRAKEFEVQALQASEEHVNSNKVADNQNEDVAAIDPGSAVIITVPRAREIHQPLYTAPISSLRCLLACLIVLLQQSRSPRGLPDVVLCNGPASATILVFATIIFRFFNIAGCESKGRLRTVYVESWARVLRLSLSGRILLWVMDRFLVQWPQLEKATKGKGEFLGVLV